MFEFAAVIVCHRKKIYRQTHSKTGVYKLNCNDCQQFYIGQTGRSFSSKFSEHLKALTTNYIHSTFVTHLHNENHSYTNIEHNMEILQLCVWISVLNSVCDL